MTRSTLTPRPRAPVLVRAAAIGTLTLGVGACGDDEGGTTVSDSAADVAPTAGPCAHDPSSPECGTTTSMGSGSATLTATGSSTSAGDSATDVAPTAGPCAHDPGAPECASSSGDSSGNDAAESSSTGGSGGSSSSG